MKKINFIGAFEKTDFLLYLAKIFVNANKKIMIIDITINQKARYIIPTVQNTKKYITEFEGIDIAIGFESIEEIDTYLQKESEKIDNYDYIFLDIASQQKMKNFDISNKEKNYFVTSFDLYSLRKGIKIIESIGGQEIEMFQILFTRSVKKEDDAYLDFLVKDTNIKWNESKVYFPFETGDESIIYENQRIERILYKNLSTLYKQGLIFLAEEIFEYGEEKINVKKIFRQMEKEV